MRIAVLGASGQLGTALSRKLGAQAILWVRPQVDLLNIDSLRNAVVIDRPDAVINAAAWNLVDLAEDDPAPPFAVNAFGVRNLATVCAVADVPLVHVSTDYVFGHETSRAVPYKESCAPGPVSVYGASKLAGEHFVRACCPRSFVVRTSGLYGVSQAKGKGNFVRTMLKLGQSGQDLTVVNDQCCTPTSAEDLAEMILSLLATNQFGLYHTTNRGETTWYDFARKIFELTGMSVHIRPVPSAEYPTKARRPAYSVLDTSLFTQTTGITPRDWETALADYLRETGIFHRRVDGV